ncbi:hypothetical protein O181_004239 [Austropuccinia psidii MF-1]|uniref:Uncharacterized protein n=1 Tax=Austropuccinia psidii MF-1 TaxID=1389203 RepID=A0A9Q3BFU5_9BASI|nr:hypothetical protein [Austropuccinia psidii MF-1]
MLMRHSPPARKTISQARTKALLTSTPRAPVDGTPAVPQLRAQLDRRLIMEVEAPSRKEGRGQEDQIHFQEHLIPGTIRGKMRRIILKERRLKPQSQFLLILRILQSQVIIRRLLGFRKGTRPILPSLRGTKGLWVLEKKEYLRRACAPIMVESVVLRLVSEDLKERLPSKQADFPAREIPD